MRINIKDLIKPSLFHFYCNLLLENGYKLKFKKSLIRKQLTILSENFEEEKLKEFLIHLVRNYEDIKKKFNLKYDIPAPYLLFREEIVQFLQEQRKRERTRKSSYIKEILFPLFSLITEGDKQKIKEKIKKWGVEYGKREVLATVRYLYTLTGRREDDLFNFIDNLLSG